MQTVVLTGPSGFVGSHVLPALLARGDRVRALCRDERGREQVLRRVPGEQHAELEFPLGDVTEPASLGPAISGADAVVHLVAIARDRNGGRDLARINTGGTLNVLAAMKETGVRRLVYLGNLGIEDDPKLQFASSKAKSEAAVSASGLDWTVLKPSVMWGERDGFFNIIADTARRLPVIRFNPGIVPMPGLGRQRFQPLWVGDLARIVALCLERPETAGRAYELGGPRHWTYREIVGEVLSGMGVRRLVVPMPVPVVKAAATLADAAKIDFPSSPDQLRQLRLDNVTSPTAVRDSFGFDPRPMEGQLAYLRRKPSEQ